MPAAAVAAPLVVAGVSALSSVFSQSSGNKAKKKAQTRVARYAGPDYVIPALQRYLPIFRNLLLSQLGAGYGSQAATSLARHGFTGSGIGEIVRGLSQVAPEFEAFRAALGAAENSSARATGSQVGTAAPGGTDYSQILGSGAEAFALFKALMGTQKQNNSGNGDLFPGLDPVTGGWRNPNGAISL
jgi:hypothetical protein